MHFARNSLIVTIHKIPFGSIPLGGTFYTIDTEEHCEKVTETEAYPLKDPVAKLFYDDQGELVTVLAIQDFS